MVLRLPSVPKPTGQIPKPVADVLNPMREAIEVRFLRRKSVERAVTRQDLITLGLVTSQDLEQLD